VEVVNKPDFCLASLQLLGFIQGLTLRTVPVTISIIVYDLVAALIALLHMSAPGTSPADLNGPHNSQLLR